MYNSHPAPPGLQVTMEKQQVLYHLYTLVYFFRINQLNMFVTENALQKFTNLKYFNQLNIDIYWKTKHFTNTWTRLRELIYINLYFMSTLTWTQKRSNQT